MNRIANILLLAAVTALGAVGGYFLGLERAALMSPSDVTPALIGRAPAELGAGSLLGDGEREPEDAGGEPLPGPETPPMNQGEEGSGEEARYGSMREILGMPGQMARFQALLDYASNLDAEGIKKELEEVRASPEGIDQVVAGYILYSSYARIDPREALKFIEESRPDEAELANIFVLNEWASREPELAADYVTANTKSDGGLFSMADEVVEGVADEWSRRDPNAALEWALSLDGKSGRKAVGKVLDQWMERGPQEAAKRAQRMPAGEERADVFRMVASRWAKKDFRAALRWADGLPPGDRTAAVAESVGAWAREDPRAASNYVNRMNEGRDREAALGPVVTSWADESPVDAANWLTLQSEGEPRQKAMSAVISRWVSEDPHSASAWLAEQPPGPSTDLAIVTLSERVVRQEPESALLWATAISDPAVRDRHLEKMADRWMQSKPVEAEAWIQTSDLPAGVKEKLLSR